MNKFFENTRKPTKTIGGQLMLWLMNVGHNSNAMWGLSHVDFTKTQRLLDIGCGGGKNIKNLLSLAPNAFISGIDYSSASVEHSKQLNRKAIKTKRVDVKEASVENIPYGVSEFDGVTAFETIYFWPDIKNNFCKVARTLKKGGFFFCNEVQHPEGSQRWIKMLNMKVYTGEEIQTFMELAGLSDVEITKHKNGQWLCVTGIR